MKIVKRIKPSYLLVSFVSLLVVSVPVYAITTGDFLPGAQKYINDKCSDKHLSDKNSLLCYLFYKTNDLSTAAASQSAQIATLQNTVASQSAQLSSLSQQISALNNFAPQSINGTLIFAYNRPASFTTSSLPIPTDLSYRSITFHVSTTGTLQTWSPLINYGQGDMEQVRLSCDGLTTCPAVTIPIPHQQGTGITPIYKFSTGVSSGNITAIGVLNFEPSAQSILLATNQSLPFTSGDLVTGGYSSLIFTVGQANPQHLDNISLQKFDGTNWIEQARISCDGGAICPVQSITIETHARYRVMVSGSGSGATISYLVRP